MKNYKCNENSDENNISVQFSRMYTDIPRNYANNFGINFLPDDNTTESFEVFDFNQNQLAYIFKQKKIIADKNKEIADKNTEIAQKNAEIVEQNETIKRWEPIVVSQV